MLERIGAEHVCIACGYTNLRSRIDHLAVLVQASSGLNPYANTLFLFCEKRADRIKALYWDADGFVLLYKRLEQGIYQWLRTPAEARELTRRQLRWLQEGLAIEQPKARIIGPKELESCNGLRNCQELCAK